MNTDINEDYNFCLSTDELKGLNVFLDNFKNVSIKDVQFELITEESEQTENFDGKLDMYLEQFNAIISQAKTDGTIDSDIRNFDNEKFKDAVKKCCIILQHNDEKTGGMIREDGENGDNGDNGNAVVVGLNRRSRIKVVLYDLLTCFYFICSLICIFIACKNFFDIYCMAGIGDLSETARRQITDYFRSNKSLTKLILEITYGLSSEMIAKMTEIIRSLYYEPGGIYESCFATSGNYPTFIKDIQVIASLSIGYVPTTNCINDVTNNYVQKITGILRTRVYTGYTFGILGTGLLRNSGVRVAYRLGYTQQIVERIGWLFDANPRRQNNPPQIERGGFKKRKTRKVKKTMKKRKTKKFKKHKKSRKSRNSRK